MEKLWNLLPAYEKYTDQAVVTCINLRFSFKMLIKLNG